MLRSRVVLRIALDRYISQFGVSELGVQGVMWASLFSLGACTQVFGSVSGSDV